MELPHEEHRPHEAHEGDSAKTYFNPEWDYENSIEGGVPPILNPRFELMPDHDMPNGIVRGKIMGTINGKEQPVGSVFWLGEKAKADFYSNDLHPDFFSPELNFEAIEKEYEKTGNKYALTFAGSYKGKAGDIEGQVLEDGNSVGENIFSRWKSFVEIDSTGRIVFHRFTKSDGTTFDENTANTFLQQADTRASSVFQMPSAIWNGEKKLTSTQSPTVIYRAIGETFDGKKFVINMSQATTQDEFINMCVLLKLKHLFLVDTGIFASGEFETNKNEAGYPVGDTTNKQGYTNVVVIGVKQ